MMAARFAGQFKPIIRLTTPLRQPVAFEATDVQESDASTQVIFRNRIGRADIRRAAGGDPHLADADATSWPPLRRAG